MPCEVTFQRAGKWSAEFDCDTGEWRAVKPLPIDKGEYSPVSSVRLVHYLGLHREASRADAEREIGRLLSTGRITND